MPLFPFISGLFIGLLGALIWLSGGISSLPALPFPIEGQSTSTTGTPIGFSESGSVSVTSQVAGMSVLVESVTVPPPGVWVAVREVAGRDLGNVLGAQKVGGPRTNVLVRLLRATETGNRYAVEVYRDDGDGVFDPATDSLYVDLETGMPAVSYFDTTE